MWIIDGLRSRAWWQWLLLAFFAGGGGFVWWYFGRPLDGVLVVFFGLAIFCADNTGLS